MRKFSFKSMIYLGVFILLLGILSVFVREGIKKNNKDSTSTIEVSFSKIMPEDAIERLNNESDIVLLDVRTKEEYETGHIKDSILIPVDVLEKEAIESLKDKEATIFIYCRSGNRSKTAANVLINMGYKNVYDLGGINNWPYEIVK